MRSPHQQLVNGVRGESLGVSLGVSFRGGMCRSNHATCGHATRRRFDVSLQEDARLGMPKYPISVYP